MIECASGATRGLSANDILFSARPLLERAKKILASRTRVDESRNVFLVTGGAKNSFGSASTSDAADSK